ncbi:hypothetical protein BDV93DRAFT_443764 [Ceratobasidium sp. AG-I]|nr:hypothetical protein BDV93DRAFT_443764 [Ceratobasidium sp. AG-I]
MAATLEAHSKGVAGHSSDASATQPSVCDLTAEAGQKAVQELFELKMVEFFVVAQIPPLLVRLSQFSDFIFSANQKLKLPSSTTFSEELISNQSSYVHTQSMDKLKKHQNLTISFNGGTTRRPQSVYTMRVTIPDTCEAHLVEGKEASGVSHSGDKLKEIVLRIINDVGSSNFAATSCDSTGNTHLCRELVNKIHPHIIVLPDPCHQINNTVKDIGKLDRFAQCIRYMSKIVSFFHKSTIAATHFKSMCLRSGIV